MPGMFRSHTIRSGSVSAARLHARLPIRGRHHLKALLGQELDDHLAKALLVINDEDLAHCAVGILLHAASQHGPNRAPCQAFIGGQERVLAVVRDITPRKRAERALTDTRGLLGAILDNIPDPAGSRTSKAVSIANSREGERPREPHVPPGVGFARATPPEQG